MTFDKSTSKSLKEIIEKDISLIDSIYRVYYENSDIPLFLNTDFKIYENKKHNLKYGEDDFHKLYLIPNYSTKKLKINTSMQYSPKLKKAAAEIEKILKENDIAGFAVLHTPGYGEYIVNLSPSYSCVKVNPTGEIRARAKLQEDFNGDQEAWTKTVRDTSNMLHIINEVSEPILDSISTLSFKIDKAVNAQHTGGNSTSNQAQNN